MDLSQYFKGLLRWWWLIALSTLIAAGASYFASLRQPRIYQTTTTLMVGQVIQKTNISGSDFVLSAQLAASYAQVASRQPILQAVVDTLGLNMNWQGLKRRVKAYPIPETQLLAIAVEDVSPQRAVAIADEVAYQLILQSPASPENQQRQERSQFVHSQLNDLQTRIETAQARMEELRGELDTVFSAKQIQSLDTEINRLETLVKGWQASYIELLNFLEGGDTPNQLTVIEPAQLPTRPVSPNVLVNVVLAAAVGFILAAAAALGLEYLDDTVKSTDDLALSLDLSTLGSINRIAGKNDEDKLITFQDQFSPVTESYRLVRANIQFMTVDQSIKSIMITSPNPGEGKTTTAANLGVMMAQADFKTIIVDADLRRPRVHKIFHIPNLKGLTDLFLSSEFDIENYLKNTEVKNLQVITSGLLPPNPSELLGSQRMGELVQRLEKIADIVIFDSPPVLAVTDAIFLAKRVSGTVLLTQAKRTRRDAVKQTIKRLDQVGVKILGVVLNQVTGGEKSSGYYYSQYYTSTYKPAVPLEHFGKRSWWRRLIPVFNK